MAGAAIPPEYLGETLEVRFTPDLDAIIEQYHNDPIQLFGFVREDVRFQPYYGSMKDSDHVLQTTGGNDLDQASLLIALFRRMGIPTRYVRGTVEIPIDRARTWLGVTDLGTVGNILATAGFPAVLVTDGGGAIVAVRLDHVWVEAFLAFADYRGVPNRTEGEAWVPLDPSFQALVDNGGPDLAADFGLDVDAYLETMISTVRTKSPAEQYILDLQAFVESTTPGVNLYSTLWAAEPDPEAIATAPASLPYATINLIDIFAEIPDALRHKVRFMAAGLDHPANLVELAGRRVTLAYEPATQADRDIIATFGNIYDTPPALINVRPELRVAGTVVGSGTAVGFGQDDLFTMQFSIGTGPSESVDNVIPAAGRYAIGIAAQDISSLIVYRRTDLFDAGIDAIGQPGFDTDETLGEALFMHAMAYWDELNRLERLVARSMQVVPLRAVSEAIVGTDFVIVTSGGSPVEVDPAGLYIDVDRDVSAAFSIDGDPAPRRGFQVLAGSTGSALENLVFEEIWSVDAVSTIKALQIANDSLIPVLTIDPSNRSVLVPQLTHPQAVIDLVNAALDQGRTVTIPRDPSTRNNWTGTGWISMDMATGAADYLISGGQSGGKFTEFEAKVNALVRTGQMSRSDADELIQEARERIHLPLSGVPGSGYGWRIHPKSGLRRFHEGTDFPVPPGTDVHAAASGRVASSYSSGTYGQTIIINHGTDVELNTIYTLYAHNQTRLVAAGINVTPGQHIAESGSTGTESTGPHLHYEIRVIPVGGPLPGTSEFFERQYTVDPIDYMWPDLTPPQ